MANREHVAILRQGVDAWNRWRRENLGVQPDLSEADLHEADLHEADLHEADLHEADLGEGYLAKANLQGSNLSHAHLIWASLQGANLYGVNLYGANLQGANLQEANLTGTYLKEAKLMRAVLRRTTFLWTNVQRANLTHAIVGGTIFADVNLQTLQGLDTVVHRGPSTLGINTLYKSGGNIPEIFLRGCGVADSMIEYAHALVTAAHPIDYYSCFISYTDADRALAERLYADLQAKGVRCWFAPHDLTPGEYYVSGIDEAIRLHDKVVLLLSEAAIQSTWVAHEIQTARTREASEGRIVLYPVRLDDTILSTTYHWAVALRTARHIGDFRQWKEHDAYQQAFAQLLRDLRAEDATQA